MSRKKSKSPDHRRTLDDKLDQALQDTFPASDPVSLVQPAPRGEPDRKKGDAGRPSRPSSKA
jgi:hypothetical protein